MTSIQLALLVILLAVVILGLMEPGKKEKK